MSERPRSKPSAFPLFYSRRQHLSLDIFPIRWINTPEVDSKSFFSSLREVRVRVERGSLKLGVDSPWIMFRLRPTHRTLHGTALVVQVQQDMLDAVLLLPPLALTVRDLLDAHRTLGLEGPRQDRS